MIHYLARFGLCSEMHALHCSISSLFTTAHCQGVGGGGGLTLSCRLPPHIVLRSGTMIGLLGPHRAVCCDVMVVHQTGKGGLSMYGGR